MCSREYLEENNYNYVVGARIKNTKKSTKENILKLDEYTELNDEMNNPAASYGVSH